MNTDALNHAKASHASALQTDSVAPEFVQLLPAGTFRGRDGRGPYTLADAAAVVAATRERFGSCGIPIDYNHQTEHSAENGRPAPAAGWISELIARPDGIFGRVEWTEAGARAVAAREFRYLSPVFFHDAQGRVMLLESAALTNLPNLDLKALSSAHADNRPQRGKENPMDFKQAVAQALGLAETAGEDDVLAAAKAAHEAQARTAEALAAQKTAQELLKAAQAAEPDPSKYVPIAMHQAACAELAELKTAQAKAAAEGLVRAAQDAGKLTPAMREWGLSYAARDAEGFKSWMEAAPDMRPGGGKESPASARPPENGKPSLTADQKAVCQAMGLDEAEYLKEVAANG